MLKAVTNTHRHSTQGHAELPPHVEQHRHAYNAAFEELSLPWHWDSSVYARVHAHGELGLRDYLETQQPHLLRAYDADFLVRAIETAKTRLHAGSNAAQRPQAMLRVA